MDKGYIYKITSPSNKIYIGQTINLYKRKSDYKNKKCKLQIKLYNSILKYGWEQHKFEIIEEICDIINYKEIANNKEIYWIEFYNSFKNGLNCTIGGDKSRLGIKHSNETKEKLRLANLGNTKGKANKGRIQSDEEKNKRISTNKNISEIVKKERNKKISLVHKGIKLSDEHKKKLSESHKNPSEEIRKKISDTHKGKILSDETKEKIRNKLLGTVGSNKGKKMSEEQKEKIRNKLLGTKQSEETILKRIQSNTGKKRKPYNLC